ncbi:MAG: ArsR/SmtB family transcription factor, partial [Acidimicrobiia bacterium]
MVQYSPALDATFGALADPSRRAIVERLGRGAATISELAELLDITLTGTKKHVQVLEAAGLVTTDKVGRTRFCRLGPRRLEDELAWIENYRQLLDQR